MKLYRIKRSKIDKKGRGLYATRDIKEGTKIINYVGKIITNKEVDESIKFDNKDEQLIDIGSWKLLEEGEECVILAVGSMVDMVLSNYNYHHDNYWCDDKNSTGCKFYNRLVINST